MSLQHPAMARPRASTSGIAQAATGGATAELTLPGGASGTGCVLRIVCTNAAYYALNTAGQSASHTGAANMVLLPANVVEYVAMKSTDASLYHQQVSAAGTIQVTVCEQQL